MIDYVAIVRPAWAYGATTLVELPGDRSLLVHVTAHFNQGFVVRGVSRKSIQDAWENAKGLAMALIVEEVFA